jgi:hypothetical protein
MSTILLEELVGKLRMAVECCGRVEAIADDVERLLLTRSSGRHIGVVNATAWSARAKAPTSMAAARKAPASTTS